ncbi:nitroreductase [Spirillospora sp. CA-255316]
MSIPTLRVQDAEALHRLMAARSSCRGFLPEPVPRELIETILRTAQMTASWNNVQPWRLHITSGAATERFRQVMSATAAQSDEHCYDLPAPREYAGVFRERRRACGFALYNAVGVERGDKAAYRRQTLRNFALFDAPHVAILTTEDALGVYGAVDCGGYLANFMLAAKSHGVATIAQGALASHSDTVREFFDLPPSRKVVCGISFGWPDPEHPANNYRTSRAAIADVVTWVSD